MNIKEISTITKVNAATIRQWTRTPIVGQVYTLDQVNIELVKTNLLKLNVSKEVVDSITSIEYNERQTSKAETIKVSDLENGMIVDMRKPHDYKYTIEIKNILEDCIIYKNLEKQNISILSKDVLAKTVFTKHEK